jgi:hypothetical protein
MNMKKLNIDRRSEYYIISRDSPNYVLPLPPLEAQINEVSKSRKI